MGTIHGLRSFAGVRDRGTDVHVGGMVIRVASLADIIKSKRARPARATSPCSTRWRGPVKKRSSRKARRDALRESERALVDMIRRWQSLPPGRRTNLLRKRVGICRTAL